MLTNDILSALKSYTANLSRSVSLVLNTGEHSKRAELVDFLQGFVSASDKLSFEERDISDVARSPITFQIEVDGQSTGILFSGIPGGHEFNSLVLAVLHADTEPQKLDENIKSLVRSISEPLKFEVFISLSCHNCPEVVQTLNQFAVLNPNIQSEMIDGGLFKEVIEERNIQGVPSVYLNGESFANGKIDTAQIIEKLIAQYPNIAQATAPAEQLPLQDSVVIGGGPAGAAAAIYLARKGLAVTIVADRFGGQVQDTMGIENLISVSKTTGPELSNNLLQHMNDYNITKREHFRVESIEKGDVKKVTLSSGEVIEAKTIIIATGAKWRELGVPGEKENIGQGVAYCPHCDGPFFKGKDIAVVGGGNSGIEAALDLAGIVKSVTVLEFAPELKADQVLIDQAEKRDNISIIKNAATKEVVAEGGKVIGIDYQDRATSDIRRVDLAGVFVQIGLVPNSSFLEGVVDRTAYGEVEINEKGETSEPGIYAAGDVTTVPYKQIVIAMGEGAKAALAAYDYLLRG
ncbi:alkyl hydroperoxide reductase subunit F [Reinekea thalattae]|uniref:Alkyl hydroperoxide reductase subunit F n=1 Tax=Reinekea thalattae TaxID=2593301 RepID=A0A5C8Z9L4_9GAMM|nr:alkyl hydroperoxide reductase subunit F [Reinekea thalattae]TXR54785.1 alkyl hydroperoxide reductase subunit F [Reinekea thalattae]